MSSKLMFLKTPCDQHGTRPLQGYLERHVQKQYPKSRNYCHGRSSRPACPFGECLREGVDPVGLSAGDRWHNEQFGVDGLGGVQQTKEFEEGLIESDCNLAAIQRWKAAFRHEVYWRGKTHGPGPPIRKAKQRNRKGTEEEGSQV